MDKAEMLALAERCEAATGPDREIDALIGRTLSDSPKEHWYRLFDGQYVTDGNVPHWTASLDSALSLVPSGWAYRLDGWQSFTARVFVPDKRYPPTGHSKSEMALALTAAALRARAMEADNG